MLMTLGIFLAIGGGICAAAGFVQVRMQRNDDDESFLSRFLVGDLIYALKNFGELKGAIAFWFGGLAVLFAGIALIKSGTGH